MKCLIRQDVADEEGGVEREGVRRPDTPPEGGGRNWPYFEVYERPKSVDATLSRWCVRSKK